MKKGDIIVINESNIFDSNTKERVVEFIKEEDGRIFYSKTQTKSLSYGVFTQNSDNFIREANKEEKEKFGK